MNKHYVNLEDIASQQLHQLLDRLASSEATVLITGETGTGKESAARYLHQHSLRRHKPFLAVNCGALSESLAESELFGHEKGAFTGATERQHGWFEAAEGGTLLLDEIGELSPNLQIKLLRVLQEREVTRVGSRRAIPIDVRIIAATHIDLIKAIQRRNFREDLYYRLNVAAINLPPLRQRRQDIVPLAEHFLRHYAQENMKSHLDLSTTALTQLEAYQWPGNIRELENTIQSAVLLCQGTVIQPEHLNIGQSRPSPADEEISDIDSFISSQLSRGSPDIYQRIVESLINNAFQLTGQNQSQAAALLGVSRNTLRTQLSHLGFIKPRGHALRNKLTNGEPIERELRIGYQKFGNLGVLKAQRRLEQYFQPLNVTVLWSEFAAGPQLLQALAQGEIDFCTTGEIPPLFAQVSNSQLRYVAWEPAAPSSVALMVPHQSAIRTLDDLRGKRIAVNKGSNVHYLLLQLLDEANIANDEVRLIYTPPKYPLTDSDYLSADAWMMWDPLLSHAEHEGQLRRLVNGEGRVNNHQFYLSHEQFIHSSFDLLTPLLQALKDTGQYIDTARSEAAKVLAAELAIDASALEKALARRSHQTQPMNSFIIREQQIIADRFYALGLFPRPIKVRQAIW